MPKSVSSNARPPMRQPLRWLWLAVAVIVLDLATKAIASSQLGYLQPVEVLPFFNFTLMHNTGAAFSFGFSPWLAALVFCGHRDWCERGLNHLAFAGQGR